MVHGNFIYRAYRTHMNSLENIAVMLGASFLCVLVGANVFWTELLIWICTLARIIHMALYYAIATEKNPSPRSYFFMIGLFANVGLVGLAILTLI